MELGAAAEAKMRKRSATVIEIQSIIVYMTRKVVK